MSGGHTHPLTEEEAAIFEPPSWEERYSGDEKIWSGKPNDQLVAEVSGLTPGTALDVGCGEGADEVQKRFQDGDRGGAFEAMPDEIVEATSLVGTEAEVAERIERFRGAGIDRLICSPVHVERSEQLHTLERLASLAGVSA